jgi:uncharacterized protein (TIGR03000 family)
MVQKTFAFAGPLLLAGAAVLMMPGPSQAQHGGGHGGGGHFGGGGGHFAGGGAHFASGGGHFGGAHYGGYRSGNHYGGIRNGDFHYGHPYAHYGYGHYRRSYEGYLYNPYYGADGGYYPDELDTPSPTYGSAYSGSYGVVIPDDDYGTYSAAPAADDSSTATLVPDAVAHLTVKVPADAHVWFNGTPTVSTGPVRQFDSPPLAAGKYVYDLQARWMENGHERTETRQVKVSPGSHVEVDFPGAPNGA